MISGGSVTSDGPELKLAPRTLRKQRRRTRSSTGCGLANDVPSTNSPGIHPTSIRLSSGARAGWRKVVSGMESQERVSR